MLCRLDDLIEYLDEHISDPVPRYIFEKEIKREPYDGLVRAQLKISRWYKQLADEQGSNGSWGRFHTQDTKLRSRHKFVTTETALRRARELSLDSDDEIVDKAIHLMERYISGDENGWIIMSAIMGLRFRFAH